MTPPLRARPETGLPARVFPGLPARALLGLLLLAAALPAQAATPGWRRLEIPATGAYALRYVPPGLDQTQPAPVIVFLHGSGALPEQWQLQLASPADEVGAVLLLP
jgi:poly(3-hydroxybutyrate) depolymerase